MASSNQGNTPIPSQNMLYDNIRAWHSLCTALILLVFTELSNYKGFGSNHVTCWAPVQNLKYKIQAKLHNILFPAEWSILIPFERGAMIELTDVEIPCQRGCLQLYVLLLHSLVTDASQSLELWPQIIQKIQIIIQVAQWQLVQWLAPAAVSLEGVLMGTACRVVHVVSINHIQPLWN